MVTRKLDHERADAVVDQRFSGNQLILCLHQPAVERVQYKGRSHVWYELSARDVHSLLEMDPEDLPWLCQGSDFVGRAALELPGDDEAESWLIELGVAAHDRTETLKSRPTPSTTPALWWVLERAFDVLVENMGRTDLITFPSLSEKAGTVGRHLYVWLFLAVLPLVRQYHKDRAIPDDISWNSLRDLGRKIEVYRQIYGRSGLHTQSWLSWIFCGSVYDLGRLQFHLMEMPFDIAESSAEASSPRRGDRVLSLHAPRTGALHKHECDKSVERATEFFPTYFPELPFKFILAPPTWLLDPQLAEYLPDDSNIMKFQQRFHLAPPDAYPDPASEWTLGDKSIMEYVFQRACHTAPPKYMFDELPQDTALQRAAVQHFRSGKHWHLRCGWLPVADL